MSIRLRTKWLLVRVSLHSLNNSLYDLYFNKERSNAIYEITSMSWHQQKDGKLANHQQATSHQQFEGWGLAISKVITNFVTVLLQHGAVFFITKWFFTRLGRHFKTWYNSRSG